MNTEHQLGTAPSSNATSPTLTPHAFVVKVVSPDPGKSRPELSRRLEIRPMRGSAEDRPLVEAVRYEGLRGFLIQNGADGAPVCSLQPSAPGASASTFEVFAHDGTQLARIGFRPGRLLPWPRRGRWTVRLASGEKLVGKVGTWYAWTFAVGLFSLWAPLWCLIAVYSWWEGDPQDTLTAPQRVRWLGSGSGWALDYRGSSGFRLRPGRIDCRIAYAQALAAEWG